MIILSVLIRSSHKRIHSIIVSSPHNYPTFAGLTLTLSWILLFVLSMDCLAIHYYRTGNHQFKHVTEADTRFNLYILIGTIALDFVITVSFFFFLTFLCCIANKDCCITSKDCNKDCWNEFSDASCTMIKLCHSPNCKCYKDCCTTFMKFCIEVLYPCCALPYFYVIFGSYLQNKVWKVYPNDRVIDNARNIWVATGLMVAPLFSLASHAGYILIAWVTEPAKTTAAFLVALGCFLFLFFTFRQCYKVHQHSVEGDEGLFAMCYKVKWGKNTHSFCGLCKGDDKSCCDRCCSESCYKNCFQNKCCNNCCIRIGRCCESCGSCLSLRNKCLLFFLTPLTTLLVLLSHASNLCCLWILWCPWFLKKPGRPFSLNSDTTITLENMTTVVIKNNSRVALSDKTFTTSGIPLAANDEVELLEDAIATIKTRVDLIESMKAGANASLNYCTPIKIRSCHSTILHTHLTRQGTTIITSGSRDAKLYKNTTIRLLTGTKVSHATGRVVQPSQNTVHVCGIANLDSGTTVIASGIVGNLTSDTKAKLPESTVIESDSAIDITPGTMLTLESEITTLSSGTSVLLTPADLQPQVLNLTSPITDVTLRNNQQDQSKNLHVTLNSGELSGSTVSIIPPYSIMSGTLPPSTSLKFTPDAVQGDIVATLTSDTTATLNRNQECYATLIFDTTAKLTFTLSQNATVDITSPHLMNGNLEFETKIQPSDEVQTLPKGTAVTLRKDQEEHSATLSVTLASTTTATANIILSPDFTAKLCPKTILLPHSSGTLRSGTHVTLASGAIVHLKDDTAATLMSDATITLFKEHRNQEEHNAALSVPLSSGTEVRLKSKTPVTLLQDQEHELNFKTIDNASEANFSIRSFMIAFTWGGFAVACLGYILAAFYLVPPSTTQLAEYIETLAQIVIVVLGLLVTYKVLTLEDSDIKKIARSIRRKVRGSNQSTDDVEALGDILGDYLLKDKIKEKKD